MVSGLTSQDPIAQMNTYRSFVSMLVDPGAKDENKLKAAQELSENFETIVSSPQYPAFLEHAVRIFLKILQDGEPHFLAEYNQLRKLILEILHRIPTNEHLRPFAKQILSLMFKFLETENEENVLVCLRIIIELHKQFRPQYNIEIQHFLQFVKTIYKDLPSYLNKIFEPRAPIKVKDLSEMNADALLLETFTITTVQTEKKNQDGTLISYNLIPKAVLSLKVLAELPIIVVLMYQLYKPSVHMEVSEFIPLIMNTIVLQPAVHHRSSATFNKEVFVDFMAAQVKTLSFLAYIIRVYQDMVNQHANMLVKGMLGLLALCPHEVAHLRKELLIAARHILATDLRNKFVPFIERLFDESVLIGTGWTTHESLRPLAYSTLADLVHHVRQQLPLSDLAMAVNLFTKNVHDESLPTNIQTMSCKLLLNLVDCIRQKSEQENGNGRDLLMRMLEVFVLKFKTIAKLQLPTLTQKWCGRVQSTTAASTPNQALTPAAAPCPSSSAAESPTPCLQQIPPQTPEVKDDFKSTGSISGDLKDDKPIKFGFPSSPSGSYTVADCRSLVKTLVCGVKTITWGVTNCKAASDAALAQNKQYQPKETLVFIRLFKYAMKALDIYTLATAPVNQLQLRTAPHIQTVRSKEEKEVLDHFAGVFTMMNPQTFKEIFTVMINYMVERINKNYALQIISNSFLSNPAISPIFATILVEYLLERMEEMGSNIERSNLYLKLFKLVFGSVSLFAAENELMLKPHLHQIVNRSMELAMSAKEPYNYYLLLRALFRSIGGGSHDQLYQEFLPLLPSLLQGLNSLQSGLHKQHMKDLFVELCLTVPVRLSSLLPYLPMLMDPLVSALNGSQTLVSQGLRTLELCVDNLQPDFLYEHIQPVRAELMQALWRTVRNPVDANSQAAFRVLGKFGGSNRKMLAEPQKLDFQTRDSPGPCLSVYFSDQKAPISLPIEKIVETAFNALKLSNTEPFYRRQSWEVLRCFLIAAMQLDDDRNSVQHVFSRAGFSTVDVASVQGHFSKSCDEQSRKVHEMALTGMFVAAAIKELNPSVLPLMGNLVRHYTMVAICQQCAQGSQTWKRGKGPAEMDPLVLIDALAAVMGHEEKELCKPGHLALVIILDTANNVLGSKERACRLPFLEYLVERLCALCYERAWYAKLGGCIAIKFLFERMVLKWVLQHHFVFLKALLFVMMDLTGEVSSGAVDMAKANLEKMLTLCGSPIEADGDNEDLVRAQQKSLHEVTHELVRQVTSPNTCVREQAMRSLEVLSRIAGISVTEIMSPHKEVLADMIPPKKHVLRHQPANAQIGLMEGNTFCTTLQPRLFTIDVNIKEHNVFISDMLFMCDTEDALLLKLPCLKSVHNLSPLRRSALRGLAACQYIAQYRDRILGALFKALNSNNAELQETAFECLSKVMAQTPVDMETVHQMIRPMLLMLGDYRSLNLNVIQRLSYLTQLFANTFNDKLCEQLLAHLKKWLEVTIATLKSGQRSSNTELKICMALIGIFHQIPAASQKFIDPLVNFVLKTERALMIEAGSPFREPLAKFLGRYPAQTVELLLGESYLRDRHYSRFLEYLLGHKDGGPFREALRSNPSRLLAMAFGNAPYSCAQNVTQAAKYDVQYFAMCVIHTLARLDDQWLGGQPQLVAALRKIWISDEFQERHAKVDTVDYSYWKEPKLVVKCLLNYIKIHPLEIELLFQLLRALTGRFIPDFQFLKDFLENQVANGFSVEWKRKAFFTFVDHFHNQSFPQDLKAKILQYVVIPCFSVAFERGEEEKLIGGPPAPDQDLADNVISVFINKLIDPENPFGTSDAVRILLLQLSCLLVEQASPHIHDAANKRQGNKLRRLMTFAWPCLLGKNCVDPATKYHGHLLLAHIIAKFAIHKRIVLQVFHSLLKAHAVEARSVVRQALEILTPAMPQRMEDGNTMLTHWTKKIIMEEGHMVAQLVHMLQLLVRHHKVYYPVRHHLLQHMVNSMQRLGVAPSTTIENKKLAVDLAEVVLKWELQRMKEDQDLEYDFAEPSQPGVSGFPVKRVAGADGGPPDAKRVRHSSGPSAKTVHEHSVRPIDKVHSDAVVNFLLRIACQVNEAATAGGSPGELLSRRCVNLLKAALKPDVWPNTDLKLAWFDKLLMTVESPQPNIGNICTALELLSYLLTIIKKDAILAGFKPLQRGIAACMTCPNSKVIRSVHWLLSRLMGTFPTEPLNSSVASKHEELECLYACVGKVVYEGLANYEKNPNASPSSLFGTLMILKAACTSNLCYIDRLITSFMRVLQRMAKEHLSPTTQEANSVTSELLILSLDLVKNRVGVMGQDMRKAFIGSILVGLIEKTQDVKVMRAITKMVEEWVKNRSPIAINQSPSLREKSILLVKMMQYIEKRFPTELELNAQFLELVNYVYREETLKGTELMSKLEVAFMAGLRCVQPQIRSKFFEVFDQSMRRRLHDRLLYIICSQSWEPIGRHYWIKQCLELLMATATTSTTMQSCAQISQLPSLAALMATTDGASDVAGFGTIANVKEEPMELEAIESSKEDEIDIELSTSGADDSVIITPQMSQSAVTPASRTETTPTSRQNLQVLITRHAKFLEDARETKTVTFLNAAVQLCHMDTNLAQRMWLDFFPRAWKILTERQQHVLALEVIPFLSSGTHVIQKDCQPSAINTFVEAVSQCEPQIPLKPSVVKYLGKSHNLWHRAALVLEQMANESSASPPPKNRGPTADCYDFEPCANPQQERLDAVLDMYCALREEDMWAGLWQKRAKYSETAIAVAFEQQGHFEQAQAAYELAMTKLRQDYAHAPTPVSLQSELRLLDQHWIRCAKELNQWDSLLDYGNSRCRRDSLLVLESAWRVPDWGLMKDALSQVELNCPEEMAWKVNLYRGFLAVCQSDEKPLAIVERLVEVATNLCMKEWRRLPHVVSHIHVQYLRAAQQIVELQEAAQINQGLLAANIGRTTYLQDMKAIVKTWRNRLPIIPDDLSHWSEIFMWRQHHYQAIVAQYDALGQQQQGAVVEQQNNHSMLGVHASAQAIIHFGKIARKHGLTGVCLDSLNRIYTIPSVPIVDCFQKIRQQVKCYLQMSGLVGKTELQEGLDAIESTNLGFFQKEMTAEFYALKGTFLAQIGRSEEANKAFSASVRMHDTLVKAWALWGDYLEQIFTKDRNVAMGVNAVTCFLHACRHQNESKSRKYLAKVLWLLSYDDKNCTLAEAVEKYSVGVPPLQWLLWIPQLLTCLVRNEGRFILGVLSQVGKVYPQAVYFPIRTLYLTLKIEQRERYKSGDSLCFGAGDSKARPQPGPSVPALSGDNPAASGDSPSQTAPTESGTIKATPSMWRCSRTLHMQRDLHPTILSSLEGIVDQMVWFRENWYEEVLRQLRQGLAKCHIVAFENRGAVASAHVTPHTLYFVKKLVSTFGVGIENFSSNVGSTFASAASESLARRAQATAQDPVFQRMKGQFTTDFDFNAPGAMKLHNLINKLKKWIKILEAKIKILPKSILIEEKCRFLSNFSQQTADVEIPGEFLLPKGLYNVKIVRFMPRVEIVHKHNTAARRLYVRGHNGKIYPYLVVNDVCMTESRREERVLQLLRMLNHYPGKQKETSRRLLNFTVPRVVAVSPQMRLVEDNPCSVSLLDIYKRICARNGVEHDGPIARYYDRLAGVQSRGSQASHQVLRDILKEVQSTMVPRDMLKKWAARTFPSATDYWTFRKMFTVQLALAGFAEFVLHLSRLNPDMIYVHQDSGLLNCSYFRFDIEDATGDLEANRPVPFRLTPNITEFLTTTGIGGPLTAAMIAMARCLVQPNYKVTALLRAILRDEIITWHKKKQDDTQVGNQPSDMEGDALVNMVNKAVNAINSRLHNLATFDGAESKVSTLVAAANSHDNLCRMDPAWHPWL